MIGLATIAERIAAVEQTILKSNGITNTAAVGGFHPPPLPQLDAHPTSGATSTVSPLHTHSTMISKLHELTTAFHSLTQQDTQLQSYLATVPELQDRLSHHASSTLTPPIPASLLSREEEVVLSGTSMLERTSSMLDECHGLVGVLDEKWPIHDFSSLMNRVIALQSSLPPRAFLAAQQHVHFERFLAAYAELIDLCNRQFVLWNSELDRIETEVDQKIAQQERK